MPTRWIAIVAIGCSLVPGPDHSARSEEAGGTVSPEVQLARNLAGLRQELARTRLDLSKALSELEKIRRFIAAGEPTDQLEKWKRQRQAWARERAALATERRKLEDARQALRDAGRIGTATDLAPPLPPAVEEPRWELDYKIAVIPTGQNRETIYVDPDIGEVLLERFPQIDREHIMVRGTLQNRSAGPWRYTFELRIGDRANRVIGRWRYQTPLLSAGELHPFEVKVPVTDVGEIYKYQIGRIEPDRPGEAKAAPKRN
ncbi:MAG: hypothetical protein OER86_02705 [Phycisphaerae bacterium]|nr:hypothetical protein [Phycisphaerae bacterium]